MTVEQLVERAKANHIDLLLVSTLMLRSALRVKALRELCDRELPGARIIVGGAPFRFDPGLWREVGADAVAATAGEVVPLVLRFARGVH